MEKNQPCYFKREAFNENGISKKLPSQRQISSHILLRVVEFYTKLRNIFKKTMETPMPCLLKLPLYLLSKNDNIDFIKNICIYG